MSEYRDSSARERFVIGGHEIIDTIGAGGMGVVYRALDLSLGREVALKILRDDFRAHKPIVARFQREAEAFARLDHPNIVKVYGVGIGDGIPHIAMEFVPGQPLNQLLQARRTLSWQDALRLVAQVADALACAHAAGIIHRDIKPANVLVTPEGKAFVTDFGIAKVLSAATQLTMEGARLGTPQYMCPERCQNQPVTPASDLFSLGVLLFQSIAGRLPFQGNTTAELIQRIVRDPAPRLGDSVPDIPEPVERLVAWMLEKNPRHRPTSALALRDMIARVLEGKSLDEVSGTTKAMEEIRAACPTPTPHLFLRTAAERGGIRARWMRLTRRTRLVLAAVLALALAAVCVTAGRELLPRERGAGVPVAQNVLARWMTPAPLYRIARETAEVALVTWLRPDFAMQQIAPVLSGDTVCVLFTGKAGSAHAGESMLILLDSGREEARILVPPTALGEARVMLATPERLLLGLADGVVASALQAGSPWTMVTDRAVRLLEQSPGRDDLLLVASASGGDELLLASAQNLTATRRLASAPHIARICPLPGDRVACLLEEGRAKSLAVYALDRPDSPPVILRQGDCTLGSHPFDDRGERALVNGPGNEIELLDVEAATPTALGSGSSASWVPGQSALVALAADHAGQLQVWRIEPGQTGTRRQLTFLDGGIGGELVVTADGGFALAALPGNGCLAVVQL